MMIIVLIVLIAGFSLIGAFWWSRGQQQAKGLPQAIAEQLVTPLQQMTQTLQHNQQTQFAESRQQLAAQLATNQLNSLQMLQDGLQKGRLETAEHMRQALQHSTQEMNARLEKLTQVTENKLKEISGQVDKRLNEGFDKTHQTFADIVKRLALIDEAQKRITELSGNVLSLKDLLSDKRSRGAFGEMQLEALVRNVLPQAHFALQHTLSNGKRADCVLFLPKPTGHLVIDAKFPLESYQKLADTSLGELERRAAEQQFRRDIKKHIQDIAEKYIIAEETADSAMMFIPAEAIFAEIHAHYPDLVESSYHAKVWLTSPTTMMAVLTTVRAVLKDDATRQQVHLIQEHLQALGADFKRFQQRMDGLQRHIAQANQDVQEVNTSARKISSRFHKIEQVELDQPADNLLLPLTIDEDPDA